MRARVCVTARDCARACFYTFHHRRSSFLSMTTEAIILGCFCFGTCFNAAVWRMRLTEQNETGRDVWRLVFSRCLNKVHDLRLIFVRWGETAPPLCVVWHPHTSPLLCHFPSSEIIPPGICLIRWRTSGNPAICWSVHRLSAPNLTVRFRVTDGQQAADAPLWRKTKRNLRFAHIVQHFSPFVARNYTFSSCIWQNAHIRPQRNQTK